jgi:hypothetical protein
MEILVTSRPVSRKPPNQAVLDFVPSIGYKLNHCYA